MELQSTLRLSAGLYGKGDIDSRPHLVRVGNLFVVPAQFGTILSTLLVEVYNCLSFRVCDHDASCDLESETIAAQLLYRGMVRLFVMCFSRFNKVMQGRLHAFRFRYVFKISVSASTRCCRSAVRARLFDLSGGCWTLHCVAPKSALPMALWGHRWF